MDTPELTSTITRYAQRFHSAIDGHHIGSPLGVWILTALAIGSQPHIDENINSMFEDVLGMSLPDAFHTAHNLLENPRKSVSSAAAAWVDPKYSTPALEEWFNSLSDIVEVGSMPTQEYANKWVFDKTLALIKAFPIDLTKIEANLVLSTILATKISWNKPFKVIHNEEMPFWNVENVLYTPSNDEHQICIAQSNKGDLYGVHIAYAQDGIKVFSVIGERDVDSIEVLSFAYDVATKYCHNNRKVVGQVNLSDLEVGRSHSWNIIETIKNVPDTTSEEEYSVILPSWKASNTHDLQRNHDLQLDVVAKILMAKTSSVNESFAISQTAVAAYSKNGFEAAAVTNMIFGSSSLPFMTQKKIRKCDLNFDHPYAVIAVVDRLKRETDPWVGLPFFSGWISEAVESETT